MGERGPVAAPDNVRNLRGMSPAAPRVKAPPSAPSPPTWLDREAKTEWKRVGVLFRIDRAVLTTYCSAWLKFVDAERTIQADGVSVVGHRGADRKHPACQQWRETATVIAALPKELSAGPNSRLRSVEPDGARMRTIRAYSTEAAL
ncbi:phage terminase small subunit P27 family [Nocardiopsis xinjiangensis]|uniref:phage terminase small subunit P27 family n=1 Tax=Nocardiopsis xinjiangensis TaxID=124285 RepID=UPI0012696374|nr:phage terminase small subunit P27 family [Nocardiopsis xinjiangensis]